MSFGPRIEIANLNLKYGENQILSNINHTFEAGQCHVVMGPNGGGKTSLLRSILGLTQFKGQIDILWDDAANNGKTQFCRLCASKSDV